MKECYDFGGWVIKYEHSNCNGYTYTKNCLKNNDGITVPLCWNHDHSSSESLLGNVLLDCSDDGVYVYGKLNDDRREGLAKDLIANRNVFLSPYINELKFEGNIVVLGTIKEVSLVLERVDPDECYIPIWNMDLGDEENRNVY